MVGGSRLKALLLAIAATGAQASTEEHAVLRAWVAAPAAPRSQSAEAAAATPN